MRKFFISLFTLIFIAFSVVLFAQSNTENQKKHAEHFNKGVQYVKNNKIDQAINEFSQAHKLLPKDINTLTNLGVLYIRKGNIKNAESAFLKVIWIEPKNDMALENLTRIYLQQNKSEEALKYAQILIEKKPKEYMSRYLCGMVYSQTKNTDKAIEYLRSALHVKPKDEYASLALGELYIETEKYTDALGTAKRLLSVQPKNAFAASIAGFASMKLDKNDDAISYFKIATTNKQTAQSAWSNLAMLYTTKGDTKAANLALENAGMMKTDPYTENMAAAQLAVNEGNWEKVKSHALAACKIKPTDIPAKTMLAYAYINLQETDKAITEIDSILKAEPSNLMAIQMNGFILSKTGNNAGLIANLNNWIKYYPESYEPHMQLASLYTFQSDKDNALKHYSKALELAPNNIQIMSEFAAFHSRFGEFEQAYELYKKCLALEPKNTSVIIATASCLKNLKKNDEAEKLYLDSIATADKEDERTLRLSLITMYKELYQHNKAVEHCEKLYADYPQDNSIVFELATIYDELNRYEDAVKIYKIFIALNPENEIYAMRPVEVYDRWGKSELAIKEAKAILERDDKNLNARKYIATEYAENGKFDEAIKEYEILTSQADNNVSKAKFISDIADIKLKMGDNSGAIESYKASLAINASNATALNSMEKYYEKENNIEEFIAYQEDIIANGDETAPTIYYTRYCNKNNLEDRSLAFFENLYKTDKRHCIGMALASLYKSKDTIKACQIYEEVSALRPNDAQPRRQLINMYMDAKEYAKAITHIEKLKKHLANDKKLILQYATALESTGKKQDALKQYRQYLKLDPANTEIKEKVKSLETVK